MSYSPENLATVLQQAPAARRYVVALSGGLDSIVLLYSLSVLRDGGQLDAAVEALHINHALSENAASWQQFCRETCADWQVPLQTQTVAVAEKGSLEAAARSSRYRAFRDLLSAEDLLLMAHHLDDQIETTLLRLLRGAGPQGLGGIPRLREIGSAKLFRPLLGFTRSELKDYAVQQALNWQEDESNSNEQHDRNYLRHRILPVLEQRWPDYRQGWQKSLTLLAENDVLQRELGGLDLGESLNEHGGLDLKSLRQLNHARQRNLLRCWLQCLGVQDPGWNVLHQLVDEVIPVARADAGFRLRDCELFRFGEQLFAVRLSPTFDKAELPLLLAADGKQQELEGNGRLRVERVQGEGITASHSELRLSYREGGEKLQLQGRPRKSVKQLLQEAGIPPWQRQRLPLLYAGSELVCVPGIGVAASHLAQANQHGWNISWDSPAQVITPVSPLSNLKE